MMVVLHDQILDENSFFSCVIWTEQNDRHVFRLQHSCFFHSASVSISVMETTLHISKMQMFQILPMHPMLIFHVEYNDLQLLSEKEMKESMLNLISARK